MPPFVKSTLEGTKTIAIYEFDPSKYAEATDYLSSRYAAYHDIPGFRYSLEHWVERRMEEGSFDPGC